MIPSPHLDCASTSSASPRPHSTSSLPPAPSPKLACLRELFRPLWRCHYRLYILRYECRVCTKQLELRNAVLGASNEYDWRVGTNVEPERRPRRQFNTSHGEVDCSGYVDYLGGLDVGN